MCCEWELTSVWLGQENLATVLYSLSKLRPDGPSPASKSKLVPALLSEVLLQLNANRLFESAAAIL